MKSYARVHGPVGVNACAVCHTLVDREAHTFAFTRDSRELCTYCHEFDVSNQPVVHEPVKRDECLGCHNPHGGPTAALVREESIAAMCGRCHDHVTTGLSFLHAPVRDGDCVSCHPPHAARLPKLLDAAGTDLCLTCHENFGHELGAVAFTHKALDEQCQRCHAPHGSMQAMSMKEPVPQLCYGCHEQTQQQVASASVTHQGATFQKKSCLNCHTPHGGDLDSLMRDLPRDVCLTCHNEAVTTADGRTIAAVLDVVDADLQKHGPIRDGQCNGCHQPHGGQHVALLTAAYDMQLYQPYSREKYAFCFQCHEEKLALPFDAPAAQSLPPIAEGIDGLQLIDAPPSLAATGATGFRNGDLNLHALHVNDRSGRACFACHGTHTAPGPKLVRAAMTFKKWQAPVGYRKTETGGFCAPGCHLPFSYDHESPVALASHVATDAPPLVRAQPAAPVSFSTLDVAGRAASVPVADRLTVLIAVRLKEQKPEKLLGPLIAAIPDDARAQVVAVANGGAAREDAAKIASLNQPGWVVIADDTGELTRTLGITAWPTILLIKPDGVEMARIAGTPVSLALRLHGYLDPLARGD